MTHEELAVAEWLLDQLERAVASYDPELREHIVAASNRLYDINNPTEGEPTDG